MLKMSTSEIQSAVMKVDEFPLSEHSENKTKKWKQLTLYDCNKSKKRFSFSTTSSSSRLPWGHKQNNIYCPLPLWDELCRAGGGGRGGGEGPRARTCWAALSDSTANSTERLFSDWRSVPQVFCEEAKAGRDEASEPSVLQREQQYYRDRM